MANYVTRAQQELIDRELARRRMRHFVKYVFPTYKQRPHNLLLADTLDLVVAGKITRLMAFVPPQYGKSELVSRKLPAYALGKNPDTQIILTSYAASLANKLSRDARDLIKTQRYQNLFGAFGSVDSHVVDLDADAQSVQAWQIEGKRGGVIASGIRGGIAGHGAKLAIIDDPVKDDEEAQSELLRDRNWEWFWGVLYNRLPPDGSIILCMTRWHEDDLAGRLLMRQDEYGDYWHVLRMPALAETPEQIADWCDRHFVAPDRYLNVDTVAEMLAYSDV